MGREQRCHEAGRGGERLQGRGLQYIGATSYLSFFPVWRVIRSIYQLLIVVESFGCSLILPTVSLNLFSCCCGQGGKSYFVLCPLIVVKESLSILCLRRQHTAAVRNSLHSLEVLVLFGTPTICKYRVYVKIRDLDTRNSNFSPAVCIHCTEERRFLTYKLSISARSWYRRL